MVTRCGRFCLSGWTCAENAERSPRIWPWASLLLPDVATDPGPRGVHHRQEIIPRPRSFGALVTEPTPWLPCFFWVDVGGRPPAFSARDDRRIIPSQEPDCLFFI